VIRANGSGALLRLFFVALGATGFGEYDMDELAARGNLAGNFSPRGA
jgi:hypothetical protein